MTVSGGFWRSQAHRRLAVISLYAGYAAVVALCGLMSRGALTNPVGYSLIGVSGLVVLFGLAGIVQSRRTLFLSSAGPLDERQRAIRDRSYYAAYQALGLVFVLSAIYLALLFQGRVNPMLSRSGGIFLLGAGVILLVTTLPSAMMAWTEPEPPEDSGAQPVINRRSL